MFSNKYFVKASILNLDVEVFKFVKNLVIIILNILFMVAILKNNMAASFMNYL